MCPTQHVADANFERVGRREGVYGRRRMWPHGNRRDTEDGVPLRAARAYADPGAAGSGELHATELDHARDARRARAAVNREW